MKSSRHEMRDPSVRPGILWVTTVCCGVVAMLVWVSWRQESPPSEMARPAAQVDRGEPSVADGGSVAVSIIDGACCSPVPAPMPPGENNLMESLAAAAQWPMDKMETELAALYSGPEPDGGGKILRQTLLRRWADSNPQQAARWAQGLIGSGRAEALEQTALAWIATDPAAVWAWAEQLPRDGSSTPALFSLAYETCRADPEFVLSRVDELPGGELRHQLIEHCLAVWSETDPVAAMAKADQMRDGTQKENAVAIIATSVAEMDPVAAAMCVAEDIPPGAVQQRAAVAVAQRWAEKDPRAALDWVGLFPEETFKDNAIEWINQFVALANL